MHGDRRTHVLTAMRSHHHGMREQLAMADGGHDPGHAGLGADDHERAKRQTPGTALDVPVFRDATGASKVHEPVPGNENASQVRCGAVWCSMLCGGWGGVLALQRRLDNRGGGGSSPGGALASKGYTSSTFCSGLPAHPVEQHHLATCGVLWAGWSLFARGTLGVLESWTRSPKVPGCEVSNRLVRCWYVQCSALLP